MSRQACMRCYRRRVLARVYAEPSGYERWLCRRCQIAWNREVASLRGFVETRWPAPAARPEDEQRVAAGTELKDESQGRGGSREEREGCEVRHH